MQNRLSTCVEGRFFYLSVYGFCKRIILWNFASVINEQCYER